jgi:hypothetical protein
VARGALRRFVGPKVSLPVIRRPRGGRLRERAPPSEGEISFTIRIFATTRGTPSGRTNAPWADARAASPLRKAPNREAPAGAASSDRHSKGPQTRSARPPVVGSGRGPKGGGAGPFSGRARGDHCSRMWNSTRRFRARPSSVVLGAMGLSGPNPSEVRRSPSILPLSMMYLRTLSARDADRSLFIL